MTTAFLLSVLVLSLVAVWAERKGRREKQSEFVNQ